MKTTLFTIQTLAASAALIGLGVLAGWWLGHNPARETSSTVAITSGEQRPVLYWYDPMSPQHHFDKPGKSPFMDMDLVPRYVTDGDQSEAAASGVRINAQVTQNIGLREVIVERIALKSVIEATGLLAFNGRDVVLEQMRSDGLVERVWPLAPGDVIAAGQPLAELLIPQWTAAQAEYLAVRENTDRSLVAAARERMRLLGLSTDLIKDLERSGRAQPSFVLKSSSAGMIDSLDVRAGMALKAGQLLARIQGVGSLWLDVAIPESRAPSVHVGDTVAVGLTAYPGRTLSGSITTILPDLAPTSRTLQVRIELPNPLGELRAGMSAQVRLEADSNAFALAVPTEAVIRTGKRALVVVLQEDGSFAPAEVTLGQEIDSLTVISAGLAEGQRIVASAQFLLDSEASLSGMGETP